MRVTYYLWDLKKDLNLENYAHHLDKGGFIDQSPSGISQEPNS